MLGIARHKNVKREFDLLMLVEVFVFDFACSRNLSRMNARSDPLLSPAPLGSCCLLRQASLNIKYK